MKFSIAIHRNYDLAVQLNAIGHVALGLAHLVPAPVQNMRSFRDGDQRFIAFMTDHPLIVLEARKGDHLRQAHLQALDAGVTANVFTIDMRTGAPPDQEAHIKQALCGDLDYVALGLWGDDDAVRAITRRFSLYRA